MISAAIDTAVSSGVRAPRSSPIGEDSRPISSFDSPASRSRASPLLVGAPRAHRADVGDRQPQRHLQQRDVELRVVGEHAEHRALVDPAGVDLGLQVAVRPLDDHLVGVGEPLRASRTPAGRRRR